MESCKLCTLSWAIDVRLLCSKRFKKHGTQYLLKIETTWYVYYSCNTDTHWYIKCIPFSSVSLAFAGSNNLVHPQKQKQIRISPASNLMCCWLCTISCSQKITRKIALLRSCNDFPCRNSHHIVMCCILKPCFQLSPLYNLCWLLCLSPTHWVVVLLLKCSTGISSFNKPWVGNHHLRNP